MPIVKIGSNTITNCSQVILVAGTEVFRLRQPDAEGQLVADFLVCNAAGEPLARTTRNGIVQSIAGVVVRHSPSVSEILDGTGRVLARAEQLDAETVRLTGTFGVPGTVVEATADVLRLPQQGTISRCTITGTGTAIEVQAHGAIAFGKPIAPPRPGFRVTNDVRALPQKQRRPK
jgi:hypothetical protein